MRRFRLSTLMLLIVIAALVVALVVQQRRAASPRGEVERDGCEEYGLWESSKGRKWKQEADGSVQVVESAKAKEGDEE